MSRRLPSIVFIIILTVQALYAQFNELRVPPVTRQATLSESEGSDFENVIRRREYWYQRNAFPFEKIPSGAYLKAVNYIRTQMSHYQPPGRSNTRATLTWKNIGPINIGGRVIALVINPKNPKTIYIGAADGGVWKSYDEGKTWFSVSDVFPGQSMGALVINPIDTNIVYAGTGEAGIGGRMFDGTGMFKSINGGAIWEQVGAANLPAYSRVASMVIDPQNPNIVYAAIPLGTHNSGESGIWKSTDAGTTWTNILTGIMTDIVINPKNPQILYTASSKMASGLTASRYGVLKTTDGGVNWSKMNVPYGVPDDQMGRTSLSICSDQPDIVYAGISEVSGSGKTKLLGVFRTMNGGDNWEKIEVPFDYMVSQGWYDNIIGIDPKNPNVVIAGGVKLIRTSDGGKNWQRIPDQVQGGVLHVDQHAIAFNPMNPDNVYIGNDGGVYRGSQNGTLWEKYDYGLAITQFIGGAIHPTTDAYSLGGTQDNGTMNSSRQPEWDRVLFGDGGFTQINPINPAIQFTTDWGLSLSRSEDFGRSWTRAVSGFPPREQTPFYSAYTMDPNRPNVLYWGTSSIFQTTNSGKLWAAVNNCMFNFNGCYYVSAVSVAPYDTNFVFAGSTYGAVGISNNAGSSFQIVTTGLPQRYCSSVRSFVAGTVFAVYAGYGSKHVFTSTDYGQTWNPIDGNLPDIPVNDIFASGDTYIIGTDAGVFSTINKGTTWQIFGNGMPTVSVQQFLFNQNTGTLRAVTHGRGMYDITLIDLAPKIPKFVSLPDTSTLQPGQQFLYAAVANAFPPATYTLISGPGGMKIDPTLGLVEWKASDLLVVVTIEASNSAGKARQVFTLHTADIIPAYDWQVISPERVSKRTTRMFNVGRNVLWVGHDTGLVSRSTDGGRNWKRIGVPGLLTQTHDLFAFDESTCLITTEAGTIMKTTDGGATWRTVRYDINARFSSIHFFNDQSGIVVTQGEKDSADVLLTADGGESWIKNPGPRRQYAQQPIAGTLTFIDSKIGWYASSNRNSSPPGYAEIVRTTDGGLTWFRSQTHCRGVSAITFWDKQTGYVVDRQSGVLDRTINGGIGFTSVIAAPMVGAANHTAQAFPGSDAIWIVNNETAWLSRDRGVVWTPTTLVPSGIIVTAVFADTSFGWTISSEGIVQQHTKNPLVSVKSIFQSRPSEITLSQNYPNPFNPATTIRFTLPMRMNAKIKIFSAYGNLLTELVNEDFDAGEYYTAWDGSSAASGVYFYQLITPITTMTKSMMLLK